MKERSCNVRVLRAVICWYIGTNYHLTVQARVGKGIPVYYSIVLNRIKSVIAFLDVWDYSRYGGTIGVCDSGPAVFRSTFTSRQSTIEKSKLQSYLHFFPPSSPPDTTSAASVFRLSHYLKKTIPSEPTDSYHQKNSWRIGLKHFTYSPLIIAISSAVSCLSSWMWRTMI